MCATLEICHEHIIQVLFNNLIYKVKMKKLTYESTINCTDQIR